MLKPSRAGIWTKCTGSELTRTCAPETGDTIYAQEGTQAHALAEDYLKRGIQEYDPAICDLEMYDHVCSYVEMVQSLGMESPMVEKGVDCSNTYPGMKGFVDCCGAAGKTLHVVDFKYGHRPVDPYKNPQLMIYAAALLELGMM